MITLKIPTPRVPVRFPRSPFMTSGRHVAARRAYGQFRPGRVATVPAMSDARTVMFARPAVDPWPGAPLCSCRWCRDAGLVNHLHPRGQS